VGLSSNFDTPLEIQDDGVHVGGSSDGLDGGELVARHVALHQDGHVVHGVADGNLKWVAHPPLSASGLTAGDALAIGSETYFFVQDNAGLPAFATVTWSQIVTLEGK
jgi:hypothetical protein